MEQLPYRKNLDIKKNIFLGTELEVAGFNVLKQYTLNNFQKLHVPYQIDTKYSEHKGGDYTKWLFTHDSTIMQNQKGVEVISPISLLNPIFLNELEIVCQFLKKYEGYIDECCSAHIHFDFRIFHKHLDALKKFILIMAYYEPELNRFFAGEQEEIRLMGERGFAQSINKILSILDSRNCIFEKNDFEEFIEEIKELNRFYALNFSNAKLINILSRNTVELRSPNGSLNPVILENNIYTFLKIVEYSLYNSEWQPLYAKWKYLQNERNRKPDQGRARTLSRTIFQEKEDLKYFDWQYEKHFCA